MSQSQVLVLTVTFLVAAVVVLPLIYLAYKKEARKHELEQERARQVKAREARRDALEAEQERQEAAKRHRRAALEAYDSLKDLFRNIRNSTYSSPACPNCSSNLVMVSDMDEDTGVLNCHCTKCGSKRRIYARSKQDFLRVHDDLLVIMDAYRAVAGFVPDYAGLAVSFPEPESRPEQ